MSREDHRVRADRFRSRLPIVLCFLSLPLIYGSIAYMPQFMTKAGRFLHSLGVTHIVNNLCPPPVVYVGVLFISIVPYLMAIFAIVFLVYFRRPRQEGQES